MKSGLFKSLSLTGQLILVLSLVSCATTTIIQAVDSSGRVDENVKIYLDGVHQGDGRIQHRYTFKTAFTSTAVELQKEGCGTVKNSAFLNRLWPYFVGSAVLVFGAASLYYHLGEQPYDFRVAESNVLTHALLLSMTASFIGLSALKDPHHSYHFQCKVPAVSDSTAVNQTVKMPKASSAVNQIAKKETPIKASSAINQMTETPVKASANPTTKKTISTNTSEAKNEAQTSVPQPKQPEVVPAAKTDKAGN